MSAVFQLISFLVDTSLPLGEAVHRPRIDVSGTDLVSLDQALGADVRQALVSQFPVQMVDHGIYPSLFACPSVAQRDSHRQVNSGVAYVLSPLSAAITEQDIV